MQRDIEDVVWTLRRAKERNKACTLLIGAGCSVKAGIPLASGFVEKIREEYLPDYKRAKEKSYPHCMAELSVSERRDLIGRYIDEAQINWAHIGIAQLMKEGYVDRVLTVNFDPLVVRACALVGVFPAVYDFAASQSFKADFISSLSVFYLHGQRTGFALLNTPEECERLSQHLGPVFEDSLRGRVCIVAGYSGDNDPVFNHLAQWPRFDNKLYWACYKDDEPPQHAREELFIDGKDAFYVKGYDADDFFIKLAQQLKCFPPDFVGAPFSYLERLLDTVTPYPTPGQDSNVHEAARKMILRAIETFERKEPASETQPSTESTSSLALKASELLLAGDYDAIISLQPEYDKNPTPDLADTIAWAYILQGNNLYNQADTTTGDKADQLFTLAIEKYKEALKIKPDMHIALNNWGLSLIKKARFKTGDEADQLFDLACKKCEEALKIKPDMHVAFNNWAYSLVEHARLKTGNEADQLFDLAREKCVEALKIKPDMHSALNNWAYSLLEQAKKKGGDESYRLFALAIEKCEAVLKIKPDFASAFDNWGDALAGQAAIQSGDESDRLFALASEKFEHALRIKPDYVIALNDWGNALLSQAKMKTGEQAERLRVMADEKFEAARKLQK
jgi:tetratricopeptide (TPR) repeat protein